MALEIQNHILLKYLPEKDQTEVTIPEGVTDINEDAFRECMSIQRVILPDTVKDIRRCAFYSCRNLKQIHMSANIRYIGAGAFENCKSLESIDLPEQMDYIGDYAFKNCHGLKHIRVPEGITKIKWGTFQACSGLKEIILPKSLFGISEHAFMNCRSAERLIIQSDISHMKYDAFDGCTRLETIQLSEHVASCLNDLFDQIHNLKNIVVSEQNQHYADFHGALYDKNLERLLYVPRAHQHLYIPESMMYYAGTAFSYKNYLTSIIYDGMEFTYEISIQKGFIIHVIELVLGKNFSEVHDIDFDYEIVMKLFLHTPEDERILKCISMHFTEIFEYFLIQKHQPKQELLKKILDTGKIVTKENIDMLISMMIDQKEYELQVMLTDYKHQKFGYQDSDEEIRKKFSLD